MSLTAPAAFYETQLTRYAVLLGTHTSRIGTISRFRLVTVLAAVCFTVAAINTGTIAYWWISGALTALFLLLVRVHSRLHDAQKLLQIRTDILQQEQKALTGDIASFANGTSYTDTTHPYSYDLDLFGKGSIYQLICRTVTYSGGQLLAAWLLDMPDDPQVVRKRQEVIRELGSMPALLENFRAAGLSVPEEVHDHVLVADWLGAKDDFINSVAARVAAVLMPLLVTCFIMLSVIDGSVHPALALLIVVNWIILLFFQKKIKAANARVGKTAGLVEKYQRLQEQVAGQDFAHVWLQEVSHHCSAALQQVVRLRKLANLFDSRNNSLAGPLMNSLFLFDIYCLLRLESWRRAHRQVLLQTMGAMIELDVYISCGTYAFNHPEHTYPQIGPGAEGITAEDLRHPLLARNAVGNDCSIGQREQFYLLTGANMTGKSTFIRTVGVSIVLACLGVPVAARSCSLPLLRLYTSMRVTDSVQDDISYFRAELNRVKEIMEAVQSPGQPYLVLLDEPLRGTNSADKQQGTRSIIETLLRQAAIGIVATHDIGLCTLETDHPGKVSNYHFESTVTDTGLAFGFKLRPGGSTSNNATILMRQLGIIS